MNKTLIIGDIHGQYTKLVKLMHEAKIVDQQLDWIAGKTTLCFIGDFTDRGDDGLQVIDWVMALQQQAADVGGQVVALLGNHEILLLAAHRFGEEPVTEYGRSFTQIWLRNGGRQEDLDRLNQTHIEWLIGLPAMVKFGNTLLTHPDSTVYQNYGQSLEEVNRKIGNVMRNGFPAEWDRILYDATLRLAFTEKDKEGNSQAAQAKQALHDYLNRYESKRIVHGHTPIHYMTKQSARTVEEALVYADGRCINVDGGMFLGGPGFIHHLEMDVN